MGWRRMKKQQAKQQGRNRQQNRASEESVREPVAEQMVRVGVQVDERCKAVSQIITGINSPYSSTLYPQPRPRLLVSESTTFDLRKRTWKDGTSSPLALAASTLDNLRTSSRRGSAPVYKRHASDWVKSMPLRSQSSHKVCTLFKKPIDER